MYQTKHSDQFGRTIIETLAYIMIMITLIAGVAAVVSRGYYKYECSTIQQDLVDLHKTITKHYAVDGQYAKVDWDDLCEDDIGPHNMLPTRVCTGTGDDMKCKCKVKKGRHIFEGTVDIGPSDCDCDYGDCDSGSGDYCATFFIEFHNLPRDVCAQLGVKGWTTVAGSDIERMEINTTLWHWRYSPIQGDASLRERFFPARVDEVSEACRDGYDNRIKWYFN